MKLFLTILFLFSSMLPSQTTDNSLKSVWNKAIAPASLGTIRGDVTLLNPVTGQWVEAKNHQALNIGTEIRTAENSSTSFEFADGSKVTISANGHFKLEKASPSEIQIYVSQGTVECDVTKLPGRTFQIRTKTGVFNAVGTKYTVTVGANGIMNITVTEGTIKATDLSGNSVFIHAGQTIIVTPAGGLAPAAAIQNADKAIKSLENRASEAKVKEAIDNLKTYRDNLILENNKLINATQKGDMLAQNQALDLINALKNKVDAITTEATPPPPPTRTGMEIEAEAGGTAPDSLAEATAITATPSSGFAVTGQNPASPSQ